MTLANPNINQGITGYINFIYLNLIIRSEKEIEVIVRFIRKNGAMVAGDKAKTKSFLKKIGHPKQKRKNNQCI
jgi:hypothetical protein